MNPSCHGLKREKRYVNRRKQYKPFDKMCKKLKNFISKHIDHVRGVFIFCVGGGRVI